MTQHAHGVCACTCVLTHTCPHTFTHGSSTCSHTHTQTTRAHRHSPQGVHIHVHVCTCPQMPIQGTVTHSHMGAHTLMCTHAVHTQQTHVAHSGLPEQLKGWGHRMNGELCHFPSLLAWPRVPYHTGLHSCGHAAHVPRLWPHCPWPPSGWALQQATPPREDSLEGRLSSPGRGLRHARRRPGPRNRGRAPRAGAGYEGYLLFPQTPCPLGRARAGRASKCSDTHLVPETEVSQNAIFTTCDSLQYFSFYSISLFKNCSPLGHTPELEKHKADDISASSHL